MMMTTDQAKFREGLEELLFVNPTFGSIARSMGTPVWDPAQPTAYVTYDSDQNRIVFAFNPDFIHTLSVEETAAVIAHETHHVVLEHLPEMLSGKFPNADALRKAHECIINDTIETVFQLPLPDGVMKGPDLCGQDCSPLSTQAAYDIFNKQEDQDSSGQDQAGEGGKGDSTGDAGQGSSGQDSSDQGASDGTGSGDSGEGQDQAGEGSGAGDEASEGAGEGAGAEGKAPVPGGGCSGVVVPEGMETAAAKALGDLLNKAAEDMGVTLPELEEAVSNSSGGGYSPTGASYAEQTQITRERMNWKLLLAKINPKVMEAGKRTRTRNNWTTYNRRMGSVYPKVILPKVEKIKPKDSEKGDSLPVLVIALDLSGSIPRTLVKTLQGLLNEIPTDLIRAYPCTWGTSLYPYVEGGKVAGGGTDINLVVNYVDKVKKETGTDPYVLVITDGEFTNSHRRPGKEWIWMSVDRASLPTFKRKSGSGYWGYGGHAKPDEEVFLVDDFKI